MTTTATEALWTCIARCGDCRRELNRAEHVPESQRTLVALGAPMVALCQNPEHNTLSDLNLRVQLDWFKEGPMPEKA